MPVGVVAAAAVDGRMRPGAGTGRLADMEVDQALERLGGVAEAWLLCRLTSRSRVRRALAGGRIVRDARGRYALPGADEALRRAHGLSGVLCLDSAAQQHGWPLKHRPTQPAVAVPRKRKVLPERRAGVRLVYVDLPPGDVDRFATRPLRTVLDCAARLPFDEALAIADSALRSGAVTTYALQHAADLVPDRYGARCRRVVQEATWLADNPFESVLRAIALDVPGLHVEPQVSVPGVGRVDLFDRDLGLVVEADSFEFHGARRMLARDCVRYNAVVVGGLSVVRFAWEQVMFEAPYVAATLRAMVARPHRPALGPGRRGSAA